MSVEVISRRQLVQAAHTAIVRTGGVTPELRQGLLEVANTATRISPDKWWNRTYDTGCLVGIYRNSQGLGAVPYGDALQANLGRYFTRAMRHIMAGGSRLGVAELYSCHEPPLDLDVDLPEPSWRPVGPFSDAVLLSISLDLPVQTKPEEEPEEPMPEEPVPTESTPELVPA